jgi:hypothetical protein
MNEITKQQQSVKIKVGGKYTNKETNTTFIMVSASNPKGNDEKITMVECGAGNVVIETRQTFEDTYKLALSETDYFNHFVACNKIASEMFYCATNIRINNFMHYILDEQNESASHSQITKYFWAADKALCELNDLQKGEVFNVLLNNHNITLLDLQKLEI